MTEPRPTNERLVGLLEEMSRELRELREGQQQLAAVVQKLVDASEA